MGKFKIVFLSGIFLFFSLNAYSYELHTEKKILDNGLTVIVTEMPTSPFVSVYALIKTGSATEGKYLGSGLSHFLEHMLFKGTDRRAVGKIPQEIESVGGSINASTSYDYTIFTIDVPYDKFDAGLDVLEDMTMRSLLDPQETEKERQVILGEMRMHNDNPDRKLSEVTFENVYQKHPYRHPIIGYEGLFRQASRKELWDYYKEKYVPNNMIVSIAGNIKADETIAKVEKVFGKNPRSHEMMRLIELEPQQIQMRRKEVEYPTDKARLSMAYASVPLLDSDLYALDVLANILGGGESSRLYQELYRKKNLVYSVSSSNYTPNDRGAFEVECILEKENLETIIQMVKDQIELIKKKGVSDKELIKAKKAVKAGHIFGMKVSGGVAYSHALDEALTGDYRFSEKYVDRIQDVSRQDILRVAQKYLMDTGLSITILKPEAKKDESKAVEPKLPLEIEKFVLDNGVTVLIREDHSIPLVSLLTLMSGGTIFETNDNNGISRVLSRTWTRGTKKYSAQAIADITDENGMVLDGASGRSSLYLTMEMLSEDFSKGLDLFYDVLKDPVFKDEEMAMVKNDLLDEIRSRKDSIFAYTTDDLEKILFEGHPYALNPRGTEESLKNINHDNVVKMYRDMAVASDMVVAVFGDIDKAKALDLVKAKFGNWPKGEKKKNEPTLPAGKEFLRKDISLDKEQAMVIFGFQGPGYNNSDKTRVDILSEILGSSFSGRMFTNIRDKLGHAYTLGGYFAPMQQIGNIQFYVLTKEESAEKVVELLNKEIKDIQENGVTAQELETIKTHMKGEHKKGSQTNANLILSSGLDEFYGAGFDYYKKYDELIDPVTPEDIKDAAIKYLDLKKAVIIVTHSEKNRVTADNP